MFYSTLMLFIIIIWARSTEHYVVEKYNIGFFVPIFISFSRSQQWFFTFYYKDNNHTVWKYSIFFSSVVAVVVFFARDTQPWNATRTKGVYSALNIYTVEICLVYDLSSSDRELDKLHRYSIHFLVDTLTMYASYCSSFLCIYVSYHMPTKCTRCGV